MSSDPSLQFSSTYHKAMRRATEHARKLCHGRVGTDHLLLALLDGRFGPVVRACRYLRLDPADLRRDTARLVSPGTAGGAPPSPPLTATARKVARHAEREARALHSSNVGALHLFLALLRQKNSAAARVLGSRGVDPEKAWKQIRRA